ncbi:hypothetical protein AGABI1DRAFT_128294 [Agaricus bisporus var. burnettii JB137-S8]|uniref:F-box domain-containing protein n=1 Tax=Agaricus bisporus var. burnettii (strain JB137-S8 / ATCC MYA-4627 / FGSC 10392) TaxID=597362 RepID=K5WUM8_AGABU|nr:uncharacterized protein AGABI1DRAFT_128294 [Agaricus bisporus var. burnettii JB137-S8]EKM79131.1 hypothetical protein AGABI1DRAFT_128294 [Agaricus bisporus var. burnettii JB137-S8]
MEDADQDVQGLTSLPTEVLSQIIMYVDGSDIPALQQKTCQTLRSVTISRQFWYNRIHRLCQEHVVSPPEEELEDYSIAELEHWTMRRIRARNTCPAEIQIRTQDVYGGDTLLVPGGRWLLSPYDDRIYFVDLDSNNLRMRQLFVPKICVPFTWFRKKIGHRIWLDHKAPRLSFRFLSCIADSDIDTWVTIHQVKLIGHGANATLTGQIIATFRCPKARKPRYLIAFNDRYFIQGRGYQSLITDGGLEIFEYRQALGCSRYPKLMDSHTLPFSEDCSTHLEFINEDVLATYCDVTDTYHIFNIESPTSIKLLHKIKLPGSPFDFSRTYWTPEASLMTFTSSPISSTIKRIYGLVIPHDSKLRPWTVELGTFAGSRIDARITFEPGIFVSLSYNSKTNTISRLVHKWDYTCESSCGGPTPISYLEQDVDVGQLEKLVAFDEDTGRSIYFSKGGPRKFEIALAG